MSSINEEDQLLDIMCPFCENKSIRKLTKEEIEKNHIVFQMSRLLIGEAINRNPPTNYSSSNEVTHVICTKCDSENKYDFIFFVVSNKIYAIPNPKPQEDVSTEIDQLIKEIDQLSRSSNFKGAMELCKKAYELDKQNPLVLFKMAFTYLNLNNPYSALVYINMAIITKENSSPYTFPNINQIYIIKGEILFQLTKLERALDILKNYPKNDIYASYTRTRIYLGLEEFRNADASFSLLEKNTSDKASIEPVYNNMRITMPIRDFLKNKKVKKINKKSKWYISNRKNMLCPVCNKNNLLALENTKINPFFINDVKELIFNVTQRSGIIKSMKFKDYDFFVCIECNPKQKPRLGILTLAGNDLFLFKVGRNGTKTYSRGGSTFMGPFSGEDIPKKQLNILKHVHYNVENILYSHRSYNFLMSMFKEQKYKLETPDGIKEIDFDVYVWYKAGNPPIEYIFDAELLPFYVYHNHEYLDAKALVINTDEWREIFFAGFFYSSDNERYKHFHLKQYDEEEEREISKEIEEERNKKSEDQC